MSNATLIAPQDALPDVTVQVKTEDAIDEVSLKEWARGRKIVLFAVPGAFTPTCAVRHLPDFVTQKKALEAKGVEAIGCLAVNDVFVMDAWGRASDAEGITMMADASGKAAQALGIFVVDAPVLGNIRAGRMALVADDGVVSHVFMEESGAYEVSSPAHILKNL